MNKIVLWFRDLLNKRSDELYKFRCNRCQTPVAVFISGFKAERKERIGRMKLCGLCVLNTEFPVVASFDDWLDDRVKLARVRVRSLSMKACSGCHYDRNGMVDKFCTRHIKEIEAHDKHPAQPEKAPLLQEDTAINNQADTTKDSTNRNGNK